MNQQNKEEGWVILNTKVPPHVAEFLEVFAASKETNIYGLLQMFVATIIRAAKCETELPPHLKLLLSMLETDKDWNRAFNFANPGATYKISQMVLILEQPGRKGFGLTMINSPFLPGKKPKVTYCVDDIFERVTEVAMKGLYKELRLIGLKAGTKRVRETLFNLCDAYRLVLADEEMEEELPDLGNYHDFGRVIEWGNRTKQRKHRTPDSLANSQMKIQFDDYDREQADYEVGETEGEHHADRSDMPMGDIKPFTEEP